MKICSVPGCEVKNYGRGLCQIHYKRFWRHGNTDAQLRPQGTGCITRDGYLTRQSSGEVKLEHVRVAERALGHRLPIGAQVHHVNEIRHDNGNENLVICPDNAYHKLLHRRMRALAASGHADWRKCGYCGQYDSEENMHVYQFNAAHAQCQRDYAASQRRKHKESL